MCHLLGGDLSLVSDIEARHASLQSTDQGRVAQTLLLHDRQEEEEAVDVFRGMPAVLRYLAPQNREGYAKQMIEQQTEEVGLPNPKL